MSVYTVMQWILEVAIALYIGFGVHLLYAEQQKRTALLHENLKKKDALQEEQRRVPMPAVPFPAPHSNLGVPSRQPSESAFLSKSDNKKPLGKVGRRSFQSNRNERTSNRILEAAR